VLLAGAVGVGVFDGGGFDAGPRVLFASLAALALAAACAAAPARALAALRDPLVWVLAALALVAAISATWTLGFPAASLRWAAVTAGFAAVVVSAAALGRGERPGQEGVLAVAVAICAAAAISGAIGLWGAATHTVPYADRLGGSWRPGGVLEYSSANALLQVSALPALMAAACARRAGLAAAGAVGAAIAAAVIAMADSRLELALAAAVCLAAVVLPRQTVRADRSSALALVALLAAAGIASHLIAGRYAAVDADGGDAARSAALAAVLIAATGIWLAGRATASKAPARAMAATLAVVAIAAVGAGFAARSDDRTDPGAYGVETGGGVLHNRSGLWHAALETFADHPVGGAGANSFLAASARHQDGATVRFAHDLPLELLAELGIAGGLLALALYAATGRAIWRARGTPGLWLLGPAAAAFLLAGLVDWPWHLAGSGAIWALALGGLISSSRLSAAEADYDRHSSSSHASKEKLT
jgi:O-antigen ligase/polysaccharide polymerase Wzy-like membrane protein